MFQNWPFTNLYNLNLDWIITELKKVQDGLDAIPTDIKDAYTPSNPPFQEQYAELPALEDVENWTLYRTIDGTPYGIQFNDDGSAQIISGLNRYTIYTPENPPDYPVTSVNGQTGDVTIESGVSSVQGRTGAVTLENTDINGLNIAIVAFTSGHGTMSEQGITHSQLQAWWNAGVRLVILSSSQTSTNDLIYTLALEGGTVNYTLLTTGGEIASQAYSPSNPPPYPVTSVNGETGAVTTSDTVPYRETFAITDTTVTSWDFMDANIESTMVLLESYIDVPANVSTDLTITTSDGSLNISGTVTGAVNITLTLMSTTEG